MTYDRWRWIRLTLIAGVIVALIVLNNLGDDDSEPADNEPTCGALCADGYEPPEYAPGEGGW